MFATAVNADPPPVYVPLQSLTERTVRSVINAVVPRQEQSWDYSQRTLLIFLLAINKKLEAIEQREVVAEDEGVTLEHVDQIRSWLIDRRQTTLNWDELKRQYGKIAGKSCKKLASYYGSETSEPYFELQLSANHAGYKRSRRHMQRFRREGFKPEELKVYWNAEQLEHLCPKSSDGLDTKLPHDPSDADAVENLRAHPVSMRRHHCQIKYINKGIEKAVFDVPPGAQIIVLNFANEQSPGGGYLRSAMAQEEVILYNSDGYRALLDLKYGRMGGGYAIPEFGLAYVRNICFVDASDEQRYRKTDMLVSACYCMNGAELYENPTTGKEWEEANLAKFRAFMAAAVANTVSDGSNTYLLLGPIGTGAFGNDVDKIAEVFRKVLELKMMGSTGPIRNAFAHIWFVSIDKWKNDKFAQLIPEDDGVEQMDW